jgi:hypothetical protein
VWAAVLVLAVITVVGGAYLLIKRPYRRLDAERTRVDALR